MDNTIKIGFSLNFDNTEQGIKISKYDESVIVKKAKKVADERFSQQSTHKIESWSEKKVKFNVSGETYVVKIKELANSLNVSKDALIAANQEEGGVEKLVEFILESKHYHIEYEVIKTAYKNGEIDKLRYLEHIADVYHFPLREILEAEKKNTLQGLLQEADTVEKQCQSVFAKLDALYREAKKDFVTKDQNEKIEPGLTPTELNSIKATIKFAFQTLARNPTSKNIEQVFPITDKHSVMFKSSGDSLEIIGLFGKFLGQGAVGVAVQRLNLLEGQWDTGEEAVVKIPTAADLESEQIVQEVKILNKIHEKGLALGIQKPLRLVKDVFKGAARHCHLGAMYQIDLEKGLKKYSLSPFEKKSMAYQLMHGLNHLHQLHITHGDIKPGNIFFNMSQGQVKNEKETRVYLADFGGAIFHQTKDVPLQQQVSPLYRFDIDDQAARIAFKSKDFKTYQEIQEKADIFAMCSVICSICTNQVPYNQPIAKSYQINDHLKQDLEKAGLNQETIQMLIKGLSANYQERPTASALLNAIGPDVEAKFKQGHQNDQ